MAGIYIHIPFCKKACHYCDFHFSTQLTLRAQMVEAIQQELILRKAYLKGEAIDTVYFGGGTPSLLQEAEFAAIFDVLYAHYPIDPQAEITLEANPDDLTSQKIKEFQAGPINRFSIGVQSFHPEDLLWMNRSHTAQQASASIQQLQQAGYENLSIDLIFGFPKLSNEKWAANLLMAASLAVPHISTYGITVETGTALAYQIKKGKSVPIDEDQYAEQFTFLMKYLAALGYEQYELSSFAQPRHHSRHNANYWNQISYLGIGPSAHSYNHETRSWNISHNARYMEALKDLKLPAEVEILTEGEHYREYILTSIRTSRGCDLDYVQNRFSPSYLELIRTRYPSMVAAGYLACQNQQLVLTDEGKLLSDYVIQQLV